MSRKDEAPIKNEATTAEEHARHPSCTHQRHQQCDLQFFVNLKDNDFLDHSRGISATVFWHALTGMENVIDKIRSGPPEARLR